MENAEHIEVPGRMNEDQVSPNDTEDCAFITKAENDPTFVMKVEARKEKTGFQNTRLSETAVTLTRSFLEHVMYVNAAVPKYHEMYICQRPLTGLTLRWYESKPLLLSEFCCQLVFFVPTPLLGMLGKTEIILLFSLIMMSVSFVGSLVFVGALYGESHTQSPGWKTLYRGIRYTFSGFLGSAFLLMVLNITCNRLVGAPGDQKFHWLEQVLTTPHLAKVSPSNSLSSVSPSNSLSSVSPSNSLSSVSPSNSSVSVPSSNHAIWDVCSYLTTLGFGGWAIYEIWLCRLAPGPIVVQRGLLLGTSCVSVFLSRNVTRWVHQFPAPRRASPSTSRWARIRAWFQRN